ncbi:MAG: PEGA domain-containing protein [Planctomycetes bacterium]|nr:PEGA domain-containing protein [Planctomycetota bacterium]
MRTTRLSSGVVLAASVALVVGGCVERKLVIRSDPPGAIVSLEDTVLDQRTPLELPFDWDGVRRVTLQAPGYRTLQTTAAIDARWYDWFPLDAFAQFLYPGTIRDMRMFDFTLEPYHPLDKALSPEQKADLRERMAALNERAEAYRTGGSEGPASSPPAGAKDEPPPPPPAKRAAPSKSAPAVEPAPARLVPPGEPQGKSGDEPVRPPKPGAPLPPVK